jgi:hypothetical protein
MTERRVAFRLDVTDDFTGPMQAAAEAGRAMHRDFELAGATWEPHDWDDL